MNIINTGLGVYPDINDKDFNNLIYKKKEFNDHKISNRYKDIYCLEPQQRFLANFINPLTQYNSILIYHSVGVGKTLSAISIAENFKNHYNILILIKNKNLELNFRKELLGVCSNYITKEQKFIYDDPTHELHTELKSNIIKEINKHYTFMTYGTLVSSVLGRKQSKIFSEEGEDRVIKDKVKHLNNTLLIVDEAHNLTNNDGYIALMKLLDNSINVKVVLMSATPVYDNVKEVFEIANLLGDRLPIRTELLKQELIEPNKHKNNLILRNTVNYLTSKGKNIISNSFKGKVSYLHSDPELFPRRINIGTPIGNGVVIFKCNMSSFQEKVYKTTLKNLSLNTDEITNISPLITDNTNALFKNSSNALTIVYPDETFGKEGYVKFIEKNKDKSFLKLENIGKYSCKLHSILLALQKTSGPVFIYSNFVNYGGTSLIKEVLLINGYSVYGSRSDKPKFIVLDDSLTPLKKSKLIKSFNDKSNAYGKNVKIMIGSPVIAEGITLKNIRQIHILEPYWNISRIEQIIGRGIRFNSHKDLPLDERKTEVYLYTAMTSSNILTSIDYLKYQMSYEKYKAINEIENILKTIAVDCALNKSRNKNECIESSPDNSKFKLDKSTYLLTTHDKALYNFILKRIRDLFKMGHIYDLEHVIEFIKSNTTKKISKKNIYHVLSDIINNSIIIYNPLNRPCNIIGIQNYYIANPEDNPVNELFFYKLFKEHKDFKTLNEILDIQLEKAQSKQSLIQINPKILNEPIYGSYIDKLGNKDDKFRIIDNRKISNNDKDKRKVNTGKVCTTYSKSDLKEIYDFLTKNSSSTKPDSKDTYCKEIEKMLSNAKKIIN